MAENPGADLFDADYGAARLDALVALERREAVEAEAADALALGGYVEPFAVRALGVVRQDADLLARAAARFDEIGLGWRAAETRAVH